METELIKVLEEYMWGNFQKNNLSLWKVFQSLTQNPGATEK